MRIAELSPYSLSVPGGVQQQVVGIARALADRGHEVDVLAPADRNGTAPAGPLRLVRLGGSLPVPANGSVAPVALSPAAAGRAVARLRRGGYDVVHLHEPLAPLPPLVALGLAPRPLVGTFHRSGADRVYCCLGSVARPLARRLAVAVAVSEEARATAAAVLRLPPSALEVLWNGVDTRRFDAGCRAAATGGTTVATAGDTGAEPAVLFVGRHERRKGLAVLLDAFAELEVPARLEIVGGGPETSRLRAASGPDPRITFLGAVADDERDRLLSGAAVLVAPSLGGESSGVVVLEAMAAGAVVVASDIPGYRATVGEAGILVPAGDPGSLAAALRHVLADEHERRRLCAAGRARAEEHSLAKLAERYLELFETVTRRPR